MKPNCYSVTDVVAKSISDYLTHETGISIVFESAIVPKWRGNSIVFKNVYISRRPTEVTLPLTPAQMGKRAAARFDVGHGHNYFHEEDHDAEEDGGADATKAGEALDDANYSMFDVNVDSIEVTLSFARWLDGKGLIQCASVRGVRGVLGESPSRKSSPSVQPIN